jgi:ankyrin repeat protein
MLFDLGRRFGGAAHVALICVLGFAPMAFLACGSQDTGTSPSSGSSRPAQAEASEPASARRVSRPAPADPVGLPSKPPVPICIAVRARDTSRVQRLLKNGAEANSICPGEENVANMPVLSVAARAGTAEIAQALLAAGAKVDGANYAGYTALHGAAYEGGADVVRVLLQAGASVGAKTSDGETPLHDAATGCRQEAVRLLLSAGADVHAQGVLKRTPLYNAVAADPGKCAPVVRELIDAGADVNAIEEIPGNTPLLSALDSCSSAGSLQIIADLLQAGANPLIANRRGETAVTKSSACGNPQVFALVARQARLFGAN